MKATVPAFGTLWVPLTWLFRQLQIEYIPPPPPGRVARDRALAAAPETVCLPCKLNLANYLDAARAGADTIFIAGGRGPCRFGLYGDLQRELLAQLDPAFSLITVDQDHPAAFLRRVAAASPARPAPWRLAWWIFRAFPMLRAAERIREWGLQAAAGSRDPREVLAAGKAWEMRLSRLDDPGQADRLARQARQDLARRMNGRTGGLCIGICGEIYMLIEPTGNGQLRERLARLGVQTVPAVHVSEWIRLRIGLDLLNRLPKRRAQHLARPWLGREVGGEALQTIASVVDWSRRGLDGAIHVAPFGCMPESVAGSILKGVSRDLSFPVLTLSYDEHTADAGLDTRLEAFVDMLRMRRRRQAQNGGQHE